MSIEIKVPELPESVEEATVGEWHKKSGDPVNRDENVVDLETDKVMLEVPSISDGVIGEIRKEEGDTVEAGEVLAILKEGAQAGAAESAGGEEESKEEATAEETSTEEPSADEKPTPEESEKETGTSSTSLSPAVRKLVADHDIGAGQIKGTGKDGRILKAHVLSYLENREDTQKTRQLESNQPAPTPAPAGPREEQRVPMTRIRARIAERLVGPAHNASLMIPVGGVAPHPVSGIRQRYKEPFHNDHDDRVGFMSLCAKPSIEALKRY